jgi:hypothetical protein
VQRTIVRERIPRTDPRLGRHVHHDSLSRGYAFRASTRKLASVRHPRRVPVFDQLRLGSCVPNGGVGCLGTDPFYDALRSRVTWTEAACLDFYRKVTRADPWPGQWEPTDTGSDGLSMAKVFTADTLISGYLHAFTFADALAALADRPLITGVNWYDSMFDPTAEGEVRVTAGASVAGGHEFVVDELDMERQRVWATNSWGTSWGVSGRFWLSFATWTRLLGEDGDVTVFVPVTDPPPAPPPSPADPDRTLAAAVRGWASARHVGGNAAAAKAVRAWIAAKAL